MPRSPGFRELVGSTRRVRKGASRVGPADPNETILVSIYLRRPPQAPPLHDQHYYSKHPVGRREHLSRAELAARHGATAEDPKTVTDFATTHGLTLVDENPARRLVQVSGTATQFAAVFSVELFHYQSPKETYRGHEGPIHLPAAIANVVEGVFGLDNRRMARRRSERGGGGGVGGGGGEPHPITPPEVAQAYNFPTNSANGQTIAVLEFSGPESTFGANGFEQPDIDDYISYLNSPLGTHSNLVSTEIVSVTVPPSPGNLPTGGGGDDDFEVALDLEIVVSVAQGAKVVAYFTPWTERGWVDALSTIIADETNDPSVLSISWGWTELESEAELHKGASWGDFEWSQQAFNQVTGWFQAAAQIGMTVFTGSADNGSNCYEGDGKAHVVYPGSDPWVTCCGGTNIKSLSPLVEGTWNENNSYWANGEFNFYWDATGGGVSYLANLPSFQDPTYFQERGPNIPHSVNPDHHQGRGLPDVAGNASQNSGYLLWFRGSLTTIPANGTSMVAPLYAALIARINAALSTAAGYDLRVGYLNPTLYTLGVAGSTVFRDINDGVSNSVPTVAIAPSVISRVSYTSPSPGYVSSPGWDACTGWGSIDGSALLAALRPSNEHVTIPLPFLGSGLVPTVIIEYPGGRTITFPGDKAGPPEVFKVG
jgi:subtilase family serine protease